VVSTCMPDELVRGRGAGGHHTRCGPWPAFISAFGGGGCLFCLCVLFDKGPVRTAGWLGQLGSGATNQPFGRVASNILYVLIRSNNIHTSPHTDLHT